MWTWLASFLGGPVIKGLVDAYKAKLEAGSNQDTLAADLAGKDLELQARERELNAQIIKNDEGRWWVAAPRAIVCWSLALYLTKVIVWDTMLGFGTTPALRGLVGNALSTVLCFWFGGRTLEKVARIWRPR